MNSLRGVGYSLDTAVADLVDNSISAGAVHIQIDFDWNRGEPVMAILDDGTGIGPDQMIEALRFGGAGPQAARASSDLGRFGLGLKTASLSQCRRLTVASKVGAECNIMTWDVDHVNGAGGRWEILESEYSGPTLPLEKLKSRDSGTLVLWEKVDFGREEDKPSRAAFLRDLELLQFHLEMVFQRFLDGDARRILVSLNGTPLKGWDPFLRSHESTIPSPEQPLRAPGGLIKVQGFILPHRDRFKTDSDFEKGGGPEGWNAQQGFYVYREKRLLIAGGWLNLGRGRAWTRDEPSRLARIRVDITNAADKDWRIDVRKSMARPPDAVRPELQRIAEDVRKRAREVFVHRGAYGPRMKSLVVSKIWDVKSVDTGSRYFIRRDHELVDVVRKRLGANGEMLDTLLGLIERTVPIERVWLDVTEHGPPSGAEDASAGEAELIDQAVAIIRTFHKAGIPFEEAVPMISRMDPFDRIADLKTKLDRHFRVRNRT